MGLMRCLNLIGWFNMKLHQSWRGDKNSNARGYTYQWRKARLMYLIKNPLCVYCKQRDAVVTPAEVVDHIKPHNGDQELFWDVNNWQALCKRHHDTVKAEEEGRHKEKPTIGIDGWPV